MKQQSLIFEILDQQIDLQILSSQTVFNLVELVCKEFLDDDRQGDGDVDGHMWRLSVGVKPTDWGEASYVGPHGYEDSAGDVGQSRNKSTVLANVFQPAVGLSLRLEYDFGSTSIVLLRIKSVEDVEASEAALCPRRLLGKNTENTTFEKHIAPKEMPTLDTVFPALSSMVLDKRVRNVTLFVPKMLCAIEAGRGAMGDLVFAPSRFANAEELLYSLDVACTHGDTSGRIRWDAISRMVFPPVFEDKSDEEKCEKFSKIVHDFNVACGEDPIVSLDDPRFKKLTEQQQYMVLGPKEIVVRPSVEDTKYAKADRESKGFYFSQAFPQCSNAYQHGMWFQFRRTGTNESISFCKGKPINGSRKCARKNLLAQVTLKQPLEGLQDFFLVAEGLCTQFNAHK